MYATPWRTAANTRYTTSITQCCMSVRMRKGEREEGREGKKGGREEVRDEEGRECRAEWNNTDKGCTMLKRGLAYDDSNGIR